LKEKQGSSLGCPHPHAKSCPLCKGLRGEDIGGLRRQKRKRVTWASARIFNLCVTAFINFQRNHDWTTIKI